MRDEAVSPHSSVSVCALGDNLAKPPTTGSPKLHRRTNSSSSADSVVRQSLDATDEEHATMLSEQAFPEAAPGLFSVSAYASRLPILQSALEENQNHASEKEKSSSGPITPPPPQNRSPKRSHSFKDQLLKRFSSAMSQNNQAPQRIIHPVSNPSLHSPVIKNRGIPVIEQHFQTSDLYSPRVPDDSAFSPTDLHYEILSTNIGHKVHQRSEDIAPIFNSHSVDKSGVIPPNLHSDFDGKNSPVPTISRRKDGEGSSDNASQRSSANSPSPIVSKQAAGKSTDAQARPPKFSRNRHGSLRNPVVQVLPDKKLLSKASSSENLNTVNGDLSALTSLVQRKRDSSQESIDQVGLGEKTSRFYKKPSDSDENQEPNQLNGRIRPIHIPRRTAKSRHQAPKPPLVPKTVEDSSVQGIETSDQTDDQDSGGEDQWDLECPTTTGGNANSDSKSPHSTSLDILIQDASQRPVPQIRQPTARQAPNSKRDPSPTKLSSSPPKSVSFNLTNEFYTFEEESSDHRRRSRRSSDQRKRAEVSDKDDPQPSARSRQVSNNVRALPSPENGVNTMRDKSLIDTHKVCLDIMEQLVHKQFDLLHKLETGQKTAEEYRETMNQLLTMQTNNISNMVNYLQANEVYHSNHNHSSGNK